MNNVKQRIPLRTLSEHGWNGAQSYQSGNTGAAPSVGRSGVSSPASSQLQSFVVAKDAIRITTVIGVTGGPTVGQNLFLGGGVFTTPHPISFPNIPISQSSSTNPSSMVPAGQLTSISAPPTMIMNFYVWCAMTTPPVMTGPLIGPLAGSLVPFCSGQVVGDNGIIYPVGGNGVVPNVGQNTLPAGVDFVKFQVITGVALFIGPTFTAQGIHIDYTVYGEVVLTYSSANPS